MQLKEAAFECDHLLGPQPLDQLERLQHARHPFLPGHAERLVFDFAIADADTEHDAAFRHYIEARDVLSDLDRVQERQQQYRQTKVHRPGIGCQPRQQRHALQGLIWRRQIVMPRRNAIEPGIAGEAGQFRGLAKPAHRIVRARVLGHQEHAEFHLFLPMSPSPAQIA